MQEEAENHLLNVTLRGRAIGNALRCHGVSEVELFGSGFCNNWISQNADLRNFYLDDIASLQPKGRFARESDPAWGSRRNYIARLERRKSRHIGDNTWNVEDQIVSAGSLHFLAVDAGADGQCGWVGNFVLGRNPWAEAAGCREVFVRRQRMIELDITDAAIVETRIAEYVIEREFLLNVTTALLDYDHQLGFVIEITGEFWKDHWTFMAHKRVGKADE